MFLLVPYHTDVAMERPPLANWVLIAVTCVISIAIFAKELSPREIEFDSRVPPEKALKDLERRLREPPPPPLSLQRHHFAFWQLAGYVFVHGDILHLLGNMFFLFVFGNAVNAKLGHTLFLLLYLLLGMIAGGAWMLLGEGEVLVGASGAIMGIAGIFFVLYPRNEVRAFYIFFIRFGAFTVASFLIVLIFMGLDLLGVAFGSGGGVAYICHLGGELVGIGLALGLLALGIVESEPGEENLLQCLGLQESAERYDSRGYAVTRRRRRRRV
jgi:membrane associated rhomboid family serine protease